MAGINNNFKPYPVPKAKPLKGAEPDSDEKAGACKGMPKRMGAKMSPKR